MTNDWGNLHMLRVFDHLNVPKDLAEPAAVSTVSPDRLAARQEATEGKLTIYAWLIGLLLTTLIGLHLWQIREISTLNAKDTVTQAVEQRP